MAPHDFEFDNRRYYIWYRRPHTLNDIRIQCGMGEFMRWECVRWFIEENIGLHTHEKRQNGIVIGKYSDGKNNDWFADNEIVQKQRILLVKVVPYWYYFDYDDSNPRGCPQVGPVYHPPAIRAFYKCQGIDLPASR